MRISDAARQGHKATLESSRDVLAKAIEDGGVPGYKLAEALKSLADLVEQIEALAVRTEKGDAVGRATQTPKAAWTPTGGAQGRPA